MIGDLHTAALVGTDARIDFLCLPRFDSPTVFAALLDAERGGYWTVAPIGADERTQLYLPDSNVLLTRFSAEDAIAEVIDFMPVGDATASPVIVRHAKTVRGAMRFRMVCAPRFDYGRAHHDVELAGREVRFVPERGPVSVLRLDSDVPLRHRAGHVDADFTLHAGKTAAFVLTCQEAPGPVTPASVAAALENTARFWRAWIGRSAYGGRWRDTVRRSALTLRLLIAEPYGVPVAAATFGLPERIGGRRNWDYRFTWVRDAAFTTGALLRLGFLDAPRTFLRWIEDRCRESDGGLQVVYRVDGGHELPETVLADFEGYRQSAPVRIGNAAAGQLQLDIYGELLNLVERYHRTGGDVPEALWARLTPLVEWVCEHWRERDDGIWEVRGGRKEFLYSRLMCWVAVDRAARLAAARGGRAHPRWLNTCDEIGRQLRDAFWDPRRQAYVQHLGAHVVGAATLRMPLVGFLDTADPRWRATMDATEADLVNDVLVRRHRDDQAQDDAEGSGDAAFSMCSFWYVECLARAGHLERARLLFEKMLGYANHLGLFAEQLGSGGEQLGNFPQGFTHLALINAACTLNDRLDRAE